MTLKVKIADAISDILYKVLMKKSINYYVSLRNLKRSKPKNIDILDFELFSEYNNNAPEVVLYEQSLAAINAFQDDNLSKRLRHYTLFQLLKSTLQKYQDGHVVECGCFQGQSAYGIGTILKEYNFKNRFMIFDSFEGLSDLGPEDKNEIRDLSEKEIKIQKKQFSAGLELVQKNLKKFDFIDYYKGWIPDRFKDVENEKFIFINIDVDLYKPIKDSLGFFYPRLCEGGIISLDDYGMSQFPGAKLATDEFVCSVNPRFFMYFPFGGAFIIK